MKQKSTPSSVSKKSSKKPANGSPAHDSPSPRAFSPTDEEIALRAYLNFQNHGAAVGHDVADWLAAEAALHAEHQLEQS